MALKDFLDNIGQEVVWNGKVTWTGRLEKEESKKSFKITTGKNTYPVLGSYEKESPWSTQNTIEIGADGKRYIVFQDRRAA